MRNGQTGDDFEAALARYLYERSEEARAVRVGEKETSEQAAIVARYADLFTRSQHAALREAEEAAPDGLDRERLFRLREACEGGIMGLELAERSDALENAILACRIDVAGEPVPLRSAQARLAVLEGYDGREQLGKAVVQASAGFNPERLELMRDAETLEAELSGDPDPIARSAALKQIDLHELERAVAGAAAAIDGSFASLGERLARAHPRARPRPPADVGPRRVRAAHVPARGHVHEGAVGARLPGSARGARVRPRRRAGHPARSRRSPAEEPARLRHRVGSAEGRPPDHPRPGWPRRTTRPSSTRRATPSITRAATRSFRTRSASLSRDHALTEIYSFLVESLTHEPGWHAEHFGLTDAEAADRAEATRYLDAFLFRRYGAKLAYELAFWEDFANAEAHAEDYERLVSGASGFRYPRENYLADMDGGFYSADYLRAWIRAAQVRDSLRRTAGTGLVAEPRDRGVPAGAVPARNRAVERGGRRAARVRAARHGAARRRALDAAPSLDSLTRFGFA